MSRPRLILVDDHWLLLAGLRMLLEPEFEVVGAVSNGQDLLTAAESLEPNVILLDISMPILNGFDAARLLIQRGTKAKLIFMSVHEDPDHVREALRVGASGYLLKRASPDELVEAVRHVLKGGTYVTPLIKGSLIPRADDEAGTLETPTLTTRQRQVLQLVAEGHAGKAIASLLCISIKTVEYHKACIMEQLGLRSTAELTRYAISHGLIAKE